MNLFLNYSIISKILKMILQYCSKYSKYFKMKFLSLNNTKYLKRKKEPQKQYKRKEIEKNDYEN